MEIELLEVPNWFDFQDVYDLAINYCPENGHFVEVGCFAGNSLSYLVHKSLQEGRNLKIDAVDNFNWKFKGVPVESIFDHFTKSISQYFNKVKRLSVEAAEMYDYETLDFVMLDAGHTFDEVLEDFKAWFPKVKKYGIIAIHDYDSIEFQSVIDACDLIVKTYKTDYCIVKGRTFVIFK